MPVLDSLSRGIDALAELAAPRRCGGCGLAHQRWCADCADDFAHLLEHPPAGLVSRPLAGFPRTRALARYDGPLARALPAYKDDERVDLLDPLATLLRAGIGHALTESAPLREAARTGCLALVTIPSSGRSVRVRGRRPLLDLTMRAVAGTGLPIAPAGALAFARAVRDQATLRSTARSRNVDGAMRARAVVAGRTCLLIDDLITTGATLTEGSRALYAAGAKQIVAVSIATAELGERAMP